MSPSDDQELEDYIAEWHWDPKSHKFARALGKYLFEFMDHLRAQNLSVKTLRKHMDNCWCVGYLECAFGYRDTFTPGSVFAVAESGYDYEFKRKFYDSQYALDSFKATWRKLHAYTKALGHVDEEDAAPRNNRKSASRRTVRVRESDPMREGDCEWSRKGATMSDASARKEFGLTQDEIVAAISDGRLEYRLQNMHGNPYFKLIRSEVKELVKAKHGVTYLTVKRWNKELSEVNKELKKLKTRMVALEKRKKELLEMLGE